MSNHKQLKTDPSDKHWGSLAFGYLKLAEQGFSYLRSRENIGKSKILNGLYSLEDGNLILASIWNIKHGLELAIKALGTIFNKQYWNDHNLSFLFDDLRVKLGDFVLQRDIDMLNDLVNKYFECKFSDKVNFEDTENNYFRYPRIDNKILDYSFVHDLKREDIDQFLNDIFNIKIVYRLLESELVVSRGHWRLIKKEIDKKLLSVPNIKAPGYK